MIFQGVSFCFSTRNRHPPSTMCTLEKRGNLFVLTLNGSNYQHRFNSTLISSFRSALSQVKSQATLGSALVTISEGKFFSNGLDLSWVQAAGSPQGAVQRIRHLVDSFKSLVADLMSLPMPTVAAISGHAAAAGFLLALSHDYVVMIRDKAVIYMSEIDIGATIPDYFGAMIRGKIGSAPAQRNILLSGAKIKGEEAARLGIVDSAHDSVESTVEAAMRMGEKLGSRKWDGVVYAEIRKGLYPELIVVLGLETKAIATPKL
ncbi:Indole-3-butyric acid response 10 [Tripterygium wilfordii]|uniref:Delta(3)-Delta(2)-enoyl-CoA isomerase n=1 Tax=Tripterygium wilfordii TaxID=458696 RepID=A0A7J7E182_TRIWF|nr:enoyl-CoA delta isomerase 2, peroxisomal-like [Tripterygium wilfordii]KAF5752375.1 Indole-3-butyric acid response 10 [Tripterygium wilfordii]